ncbi:hypothetical protein LEM8419_02541 [Neolewinella maritima]|uniref:Tryptophan-rich sensory protein n=1 Tax=Neolewinella maritima TaxID=1383882 RepID=A0ABN8F3U6_9BACT|nr:hypothetical protein [Neolewinella maritima]CAH1001636.1 hypothetical protein LEM8419_02541 [Neolewinella maritima]
MHLSTRTWRYIPLVTFITVPIVNYLPIVLDISQDRFTDDVTTRVSAAGYAFSIWGVIFTGMIVFAAVQLRTLRKTKALKRAYKYLVLAGLASIAFVPISLYGDQVLGFADLLWHLLALLAAYTSLRIHVAEIKPPAYGWSYFAPSMYLGWISAATVISASLALDQLGVTFEADTAVYIATALVGVLTALGTYLALRADIVYAGTVAWALVAVAIKQQDAPLLFWAGGAGAVFLVGLCVWIWLSERRAFYAVGRG